MTIDELLAELRVRYPNGPPWRERLSITNMDILKWTASAGMSRQDLYDQLALELAHGFNASELSFEFCDAVVNEIHWVIIFCDEQRPHFSRKSISRSILANIFMMVVQIKIRLRRTHGPK